jgi:hypothetical protein
VLCIPSMLVIVLFVMVTPAQMQVYRRGWMVWAQGSHEIERWKRGARFRARQKEKASGKRRKREKFRIDSKEAMDSRSGNTRMSHGGEGGKRVTKAEWRAMED